MVVKGCGGVRVWWREGVVMGGWVVGGCGGEGCGGVRVWWCEGVVV